MTIENSSGSQTMALHFACTVSLFAFAGPPIGAASVILAILAFRLPGTPPDLTGMPVLSVLAMSYVLGLVPAIIAGLLVASRGLWSGASFGFTMVTASLAMFLPILAYGLLARPCSVRRSPSISIFCCWRGLGSAHIRQRPFAG